MEAGRLGGPVGGRLAGAGLVHGGRLAGRSRPGVWMLLGLGVCVVGVGPHVDLDLKPVGVGWAGT